MGENPSKHLKETPPMSNFEAAEQGRDSYLETVVKKIEKAFPTKGRNETKELAEWLSEKEKFKKQYFVPLQKRAASAMRVTFEEAKAFGRSASSGYPNESTKQGSQDRITDEIQAVKKLEVHLLLYELKDEHLKQETAKFFHKYVHSFTFGPYHAALKIGDMVLEWDDSSLIIPRPASDKEDTTGRTLVFEANVHEGNSSSDLEIQEVPVRAGAERTLQGINKQVNYLLDITEEKEHLLDSLAHVIVMYNTKFHYGLFTCNCHHFAIEMLSAMGKEDDARLFQRKTQEHADILIKRGDKAVAEFNNHKDLDDYVTANIDTMSQEDDEFCHCHYLLFHAWNKKFPNKPAWKCDSTCQSAKLALKIQ